MGTCDKDTSPIRGGFCILTFLRRRFADFLFFDSGFVRGAGFERDGGLENLGFEEYFFILLIREDSSYKNFRFNSTCSGYHFSKYSEYMALQEFL